MPKNVETTAQLHSSHMLTKQCSKFSKPGSNSTWNMNFQMTTSWISNRQRNQISNCQHWLDHRKSRRVPEKHLLQLYWLCQSLWPCGSQAAVENSERVGIPDHLTCLLRNLYAGEEATVRTGHGTTDWFQIGKGVCQGCILLPCLFNLYAEDIMWNAGLDEAGIKNAGRNINNLRYADDTTHMAESKEELKSLLMKVKEESEKLA